MRAVLPLQALLAVSMLKTTAFAFYFIVSSCCWMGSSCFIVGPKKQFANMKQPKRRNCASGSRLAAAPSARDPRAIDLWLPADRCCACVP
jgi:hypothetical protein